MDRMRNSLVTFKSPPITFDQRVGQYFTLLFILNNKKYLLPFVLNVTYITYIKNNRVKKYNQIISLYYKLIQIMRFE